MARTIDDRLSRLNNRRKGIDRLDALAADARADAVAKVYITEAWERRASAQPHTRYALGAMQQVDPAYTQKSIDTAERVAKTLREGLKLHSVTTRLQGSVPLNVHIRGVSDVDLLTLDDSFFTYATAGNLARGGYYGNSSTRTSLGVLSSLRSETEELLIKRYWGTNVDCSGGKAITLSGGSLERPVDVVPAHWFDCIEFQVNRHDYDRGVTILNKKIGTTIDNTPFLHIKRVDYRDAEVLGGLKKAIRLVKTVKSDADEAGHASELPSYDIAALLYHADQSALQNGAYRELSILAEAQRFLDWCYLNKDSAKALKTPDGARCILDTEKKYQGLWAISIELDDLARRVAAEQLNVSSPETLSWPEIYSVLRTTVVAAAAA